MAEILTNVRASSVMRARRLLQGKYRTEDNAFLAEGPQSAREAALSGDVKELFITPDCRDRYPEIAAAVDDFGGVVTPSDEDVIASLSSSVTPQGVVAVVRSSAHTLDSVLKPGATLVAALAYVRDPGNAGSVIRVADAAGATGVIASTESVDLHNPKVVRASAGSLFHIPVVEEIDITEAIAQARALGMQVFAADGSGEPFTTGVDLSLPTMWVFGNEAWGVPQEVLDAVDRVVSIPIYGRAESLNLATAAAVCLYASAQAQQ